MDLKVILTCAEEFEKHESLYKQFLNEIAENPSPAVANMGYEEPAGLCYLVQNKKRWTKETGQIALLKDGVSGRFVGVSAVENSTLSDKLGSGGNRCWLLNDYRKENEVTRFLLSSNLDWCAQQGKLGMLLTFNEYNKILYDTVVRISKGQAGALGTVWSSWWNDCIPLPKKIRLFTTPQWAIVKPIKPGYELESVIKTVVEKYGVRDTPFIKTNA